MEAIALGSAKLTRTCFLRSDAHTQSEPVLTTIRTKVFIQGRGTVLLRDALLPKVSPIRKKTGICGVSGRLNEVSGIPRYA